MRISSGRLHLQWAALEPSISRFVCGISTWLLVLGRETRVPALCGLRRPRARGVLGMNDKHNLSGRAAGGGSGPNPPKGRVIRERVGGGGGGNNAGNCGCCHVNYGGAFSTKNFTDIEGFVSSLRTFLEDPDISISVVVQHSNESSKRGEWDVPRLCNIPRHRMYDKPGGWFGGACGSGEVYGYGH